MSNVFSFIDILISYRDIHLAVIGDRALMQQIYREALGPLPEPEGSAAYFISCIGRGALVAADLCPYSRHRLRKVYSQCYSGHSAAGHSVDRPITIGQGQGGSSDDLQRRSEFLTFTHFYLYPGVKVRVSFKTEDEAAAFAREFGGTLVHQHTTAAQFLTPFTEVTPTRGGAKVARISLH